MGAVVVSARLCVVCRGYKRLCGRVKCPILERLRVHLRLSRELRSTHYQSHSGSALVFEARYPSVYVGPQLAVQVVPEYVAFPELMWGLDLDTIVRIRSSTLYSYVRLGTVRARVMDEVRDVALSIRPVLTEVRLRKRPILDLKFDGVTEPIGPRAPLDSISLSENPCIPYSVERLIEELGRTRELVVELYRRGFIHSYIARVISCGLAGAPHRRRLVPTRWSISATDKVLSDFFVEQVRRFPVGSDYLVSWCRYLGNIYVVVLLPERWGLELIEVWLPSSVWVQVGGEAVVVRYCEYFRGGSVPSDGGYLAVRYAVSRYLYEVQRRQYRGVVLRVVTSEYYSPVGSWQIRESIVRALRSNVVKLTTIDEVLNYIDEVLRPYGRYLRESDFLKAVARQERL